MASWQTMQNEAHGTAASRLEWMSSSHCWQVQSCLLGYGEGPHGISKLVKFAVEIVNRDSAFRGPLDLFQLIGASLNHDPVAMRISRSVPQPWLSESLKSFLFIFDHWLSPLPD